MLTDVVVPRMSGRELVAQVLSLFPGTPFLYMSGYADDVLGEGWRLSPEAPLLTKPFTPELLARKVRQVLGGVTPSPGPPMRP